MTDTGYYLYGIIKNMPLADNIPGLDSRGSVFVIPFNDLAGIVSTVNLAEFGEVPLKQNLESLDWVRDKVFGHERVIEVVMKQTAVIPMKFCTIFNSRERVLEELEKKCDFFIKLLEAYSDKREWGIKIYESIKSELSAKPAASGREYLKLKKAQQDTALEHERRVNAMVEKIFKKINSLAESSRINRPTPKELLPHKDKEQILNASFLVLESKEKELSKLVDETARQYSEESLIVELIGPLPVYSFITSNSQGISNGNDN